MADGGQFNKWSSVPLSQCLTLLPWRAQASTDCPIGELCRESGMSWETPCQGTHSQPFGTVWDSPGLRACGAPQHSQCAVCTSPLVPPQRNHPVQPSRWANIASSGGDITASCPKRGTDSSFLSTLCPHCSLTVPRLLLPHGTNGSGSVRGRLCFCSANFQYFCM